MADTMNQYLTFKLMDEQYAFDVGQVQEVLEMKEITHLPGMPAFMRGVINIRGRVVPVVDLRTKLGLDRIDESAQVSIIVVELELGSDDGRATVGCLADSVQEVTNIDASSLEPPPKMGSAVQSRWIRAIGKREEGFVMILALDKIFDLEELETIAAETGGQAAQVRET